jgi:hypothetical protein
MDTAESEMVQVAAGRELLDRGYGKPAQTVEVQGGQKNVYVIALSDPTRDPLARPTIEAQATEEGLLDLRGVLEPPWNRHPSR